MRLQPKFWNKKNFLSNTLLPLSFIYYLINFLYKNFTKSEKSNLPIICVGNITVGGSGKTPIVKALGKICKSMNKNPAILLRGYGGNSSGPLKVNNKTHTTLEVGDEAILHSTNFKTWISKNRYQGAREIERELDIDVIIMDDGLQNKSLEKDLKIIVFDGNKGAGNKRLLPAGPLREPFNKGVTNADVCIILGDDKTDLKTFFSLWHPKIKLLKAKIIPNSIIVKSLLHKKIIAFAGIGMPEKFFSTLKKLNLELIQTVNFPDHKKYKIKEINYLLNLADKKNALLVTTEKDIKRIHPLNVTNFKKIVSLPIDIEFENEGEVKNILEKIFNEFNK